MAAAAGMGVRHGAVGGALGRGQLPALVRAALGVLRGQQVGAVRYDVTGEPIKQLTKLIGEPVIRWVNGHFAKHWVGAPSGARRVTPEVAR